MWRQSIQCPGHQKGGIRLKVLAKAKGNIMEFQREIKEKTNLATNAEIIRTTGLVVIEI